MRYGSKLTVIVCISSILETLEYDKFYNKLFFFQLLSILKNPSVAKCQNLSIVISPLPCTGRGMLGPYMGTTLVLIQVSTSSPHPTHPPTTSKPKHSNLPHNPTKKQNTKHHTSSSQHPLQPSNAPILNPNLNNRRRSRRQKGRSSGAKIQTTIPKQRAQDINTAHGGLCPCASPARGGGDDTGGGRRVRSRAISGRIGRYRSRGGGR